MISITLLTEPHISKKSIIKMTALTYTNIFKKNLSLFIKTLNFKKLIKLFLHSLMFRCFLLLIALFSPNYYGIISFLIFIFLFIVKPYANSNGVLKQFFSNFLFIFFSISTVFTMWFIIIEFLNLIYPSFSNFIMLELLIKIAGLKFINYDDIPNGKIENLVLDNDKSETFGKKTPESCSVLAKMYNNLFNSNNKPVFIIKPFPIIKEAYVKASSLSTETSNSNTTLTEYLSDKVGENKNKQIALSSQNDPEISSSSLSSSSSSYDTLIIDLKILEGIDGKNKRFIILKDINDPSSENLISILNKPNDIKVSYDKVHIQEKNCANYKYLSLNTQNYNSVNYQVKMHEKYVIYGPGYNSPHNYSLSINNEAVNRINNNSLIIESENRNIIPFKEIHSFASTSRNLPSEYWKINIPVPQSLDSINVLSKIDGSIENCSACNNMN